MSKSKVADPPSNSALKVAELKAFSTQRNETWKQLPKSHGYWGSRYLAPKMREVFSCVGVIEFFAQGLASRHDKSQPLVCLSLGSGLCVIEQSIVVRLREMGFVATMECTEMSPERVEEANKRFSAASLSDIISAHEVDMNTWTPRRKYSAIMANHSLHHFVELERIFDNCLESLGDDGVFAINDMIGRNGHQRWPEVWAILASIWATMPHKYRYNHPYSRFDEQCDNRDYSLKSFEGVRAQDIMPLLNERFRATHFVAEAGLIDPFIERMYGHNFSIESQEDCAFIERIGYMNDMLIDCGMTKPTLALGWFVNRSGNRQAQKKHYRHWDQEFCTRQPN